MKRFLGLLVAAVLVVGACGGDDDAGPANSDDAAAPANGDDGNAVEDPAEPEPTDDPLVAALSASIREPGSSDDALPTAEEASCSAQGTVDTIGADRLAELGVTADRVPAELSEYGFDPDELEAVVDIELGCIDFRRLLSETFVADGVLGESGAECLAAAFPADLLRLAALAEGRGDTEALAALDVDHVEALSAAAPDCLTVEELAATGLG